jgi:hypothetical protein
VDHLGDSGVKVVGSVLVDVPLKRDGKASRSA